MVGIGRRMNRLKTQIMSIRLGPGAAVLPSNVTRIHMHFAKQGKDGHFGAKEFFSKCLPRLKYWNPAVPMIVNRLPGADKAVMTIFIRRTPADADADATSPSSRTEPYINPNNQPTSSFQGKSTVPEPLPEERTVQVEMLRARSSDILKALLKETKAEPVVPTEQEEIELQEIRERQAKSEVDRELMARKNAEKKREAAIMQQARKEAAAMKQATL